MTSAPKTLGKPKGKRKKKVDITAFVQADLQDFKQKQAQRQSLDLATQIKREPESEQMPSVVTAGGVDAPPTAQKLAVQPTPVPQDDARLSSSALHVVTNFAETVPIPPVPVPEIPSSPSIVLPDIQEIKQPATLIKETPPPPVLRPLLISEDSSLGQLFKWYEEYTSAETTSPQDIELPEEQGEKEVHDSAGLAEDIAALDCAAQDSNKWFHIVALTPGHAGVINMEFKLEINATVMGAITKWVNRSTLRLR